MSEIRKANVIAFLNEKGGVGKTTTTVSVGAELAERGSKVLLIDLDPQCSLSLTFGISDPEFTIYDSLIDPSVSPEIVHVRKLLDVIPSDIVMSSADVTLAAKMERERILSKVIEKMRSLYDYILLDCPPYLGIVTINALIACDHLFVPVVAETLPVRGLKVLEQMLEIIKPIKEISISGIIITRYDSRKNINKSLDLALRLNYKDKVFRTNIRENTEVAKAPTFQKTIYESAPDSHGAEDYRRLTEEIVGRLKGNS